MLTQIKHAIRVRRIPPSSRVFIARVANVERTRVVRACCTRPRRGVLACKYSGVVTKQGTLESARCLQVIEDKEDCFSRDRSILLNGKLRL